MILRVPFALQGSVLLAFVLTLGAVSGCGGNTGPGRYELSGSVTYQDKSVPAGEISFTPDSSKGNSGPGSIARIVDGRYQTEPGKGIVGGAYTVRIYGYDGVAIPESSDGTPLFPSVTMDVDLPDEGGQYDFKVPEAKSKR